MRTLYEYVLPGRTGGHAEFVRGVILVEMGRKSASFSRHANRLVLQACEARLGVSSLAMFCFLRSHWRGQFYSLAVMFCRFLELSCATLWGTTSPK